MAIQHIDGLPDDISDELRNSTSLIVERFGQTCMDETQFEFALLVMTFMPSGSIWQDGAPWGAAHWLGQKRKVRLGQVPRGLPLGAFADARPAHAEWNAAWWMAGLKPDRSGIVMRMLLEQIDNPMVPLEDGNWAVTKIAGFAQELESRS
jgi:hypothetical protein